MFHVLHSEVEVELVLWPSSAAAADPPTAPRLRRPPLLVVEVDVEPALLVELVCLDSRTMGMARALAKRATKTAVTFIFAVGVWIEKSGWLWVLLE